MRTVRALQTAAAAAALVAGLAPVAALVAQSSSPSPVTLDLFASRKESSSSPLFGGLSLGTWAGPLGLRLGAGLNLRNDDGGDVYAVQAPERCRRGGPCRPGGVRYAEAGSFGPTVGAWSADADLMVEPFRQAPAFRTLLLGFSPYAFAGIGHYEAGVGTAGDTSFGTWSYGGGVTHPFFGRTGLTAEARYRQPLHSQVVVSPGNVARDAWEYRVGFSIGLGGHGNRRSATAASAPDATVASAAPADVRDDARTVSRVLDAADGLIDSPYAANGASPSRGFDAAGFVQYVFGKEGVELPRTVRELAAAGSAVPTRAGSLKPGDLLFFANDGSHVDHVAVYVGHDRIVHATASGNGVRYDDLGEGERGQWFSDHLVEARRVVGAVARSVDDDAPAGADRAPRPRRP